jgi:hypothetical protein
MVTRYPHTATVMGPDGTISNGEWVAATTVRTELNGRLELANQPAYAVDGDGDSVQIKATFFTKDAKVADAKTLECRGYTFKVLGWIEEQTHSFIWLG